MDEVKSPMYATGVGLVIQGLKDLEKVRTHGRGTTTLSTPQEIKTSHKGSWFNVFFNKSKDLFTDEGEDSKF